MYLSRGMWWLYMVMAFFGILLNVIFIHATTKTKDRRLVTDTSITIACTIATFNGIQHLVRCILNQYKDKLSGYLMETILDALVFLLDGSYLWIFLIINAGRYRVLKEVNNPRNHNEESRKILKAVISILVLSFLLTSGYGVLIFFSNIRPSPNIGFGIKIMHVIAKEIPLAAITCLHVVLFKKSFVLMSNRCKTTIEMKRILYRSIFHLTVCQMFTFVIPGLFVYGVELTEFHINLSGENLHSLRIAYWTFKHLLIMFNPINFGILQSPRRGFVLSCLGCVKSVKAEEDSTEEAGMNKAVVINETQRKIKEQNKVEQTITSLEDCNSMNIKFSSVAESTETERLVIPNKATPILALLSNDGGLDEVFLISPILQNSTADQIFFKRELQQTSKRKAPSGIDDNILSSVSDISSKSHSQTPVTVFTDEDESELVCVPTLSRSQTMNNSLASTVLNWSRHSSVKSDSYDSDVMDTISLF